MTSLTDLTLRAGIWLTEVAPTPTPTPSFGVYTGDPDLVTPGVIGFVITFGIAAATLLLVLDMTRRVRRTRYTEEIRQKLRDEADAAPTATPPADS
jgi:hypothetical protein